MNLSLESYESQNSRWPARGRHILAHFDRDSVVVYQAFRAPTAEAAVRENRFNQGFSMDRMSWIKPNFLWMMYRSGWASKEGQERVLAVRLSREGFGEVLSRAVHSSHTPEIYGDRGAWRQTLKHSEVRLQWDPDHDPYGKPCARRALQLGLSGLTLARYVHNFTLAIEDITDFVHAQRQHLLSHRLDLLETPREEVFHVADEALAARLGLRPEAPAS